MSDSKKPRAHKSDNKDQNHLDLSWLPQDTGVPRTHYAKAVAVGSGTAVGVAVVWRTYAFAPDWFGDAIHEARQGQDHHARRREIVFAVSCAESYLLEWVRDDVLQKDFEKLDTYFEPGNPRPINEKWKEVPKKLQSDSLIPSVPDLGQPYWEEFLKLVEYRNGLLHGAASLPETNPPTGKRPPIPSKDELDKLDAGWAARAVGTLIRKLHDTVGTTPPRWLVDP